jgi:hypothetical protein
MSAIAALGAVPILIWNAKHEWVTFRHVGWQAGALDRSGWRWLGPLEFISGQFALLLGYWFVVWAAAMWRYRPRSLQITDCGLRIEMAESELGSGKLENGNAVHAFLWWLSAPTFVAFLAASVKTTGQLNWAVTAYLSGGVLAAAWLGRVGPTKSLYQNGWWRWGAITAGAVGLILNFVAHYPSISRPVLASIVGAPTTKHPLPLRRVDPTARLRGYRALASAVDRLRDQVRAGGEDPIVAATIWNIPGLLGVYCEGHPTVYSLGPALYDRASQLDFWRPNPVWDPEAFRGRTFVLVGDFTPPLLAAFDKVTPPQEVRYSEAGQPIALWYVGIGYGYRGFGPIEEVLRNRRY